MHIHVGDRDYGVVDRMTNGWHVTTRFGCAWGIPILPSGSVVVLRRGSVIDELPIPLNWKSVFVVYLRMACYIGVVLGGLVLLRGLKWGGPEGNGFRAAVVYAPGAAAALVWSYRSKWLRFAAETREVVILQRVKEMGDSPSAAKKRTPHVLRRSR